MKTLKCDLCDHEVRAETFEDWMELLKPHCSKEHSEFMNMQAKKPKEEQMAEIQKWMNDNKKRFDDQPID
ncbi:hypothetical protein C0584_03165 [Candidatus Parcubacteria bacterium]|nr:MAG: hypothetical protein C0584_03165 [Candidatus Parcubacteria bacterium]